MQYADVVSLFAKDTNDNLESYVPIAGEVFMDLMSSLSGKDIVLTGLFAVEDFGSHKGFTIFYVLEKRGCRNVVVLLKEIEGATTTSVARLFPSACWFEREAHDGFGIDFTDAFDKRPLFLHEMYPEGFHPLLKSFANRPLETKQNISPKTEYRFKEMSGEGVYQIPVGPVHAGIIEPGHFRFSVIGETIFNLEIRMFYKHRGIEKLAEGKTPEQCITVAETISGDESAINAFAFASAVEKICGVTVPMRAADLRTILLEMERIYSHLGDLAGMVVDVAFPRGASRFFVLREEVLRWNAKLTGSRFLKGIIYPGGLSQDVTEDVLTGLPAYLETFVTRFESLLYLIYSTASVIDRLETTGIIDKKLVDPLNITGPAARAAGFIIDTRRDHPYGNYEALEFKVRTAETSDVVGRFYVKVQEIFDSVGIIRSILNKLALGPIYTGCVYKDGHALILVESPRGQSLHWLMIKDGVIARYKIRTASFCNWQAIEHAVLGNIVPDFPLINKSLNLSYASTDL
jgi:formate hydrogenlyase subunit 5